MKYFHGKIQEMTDLSSFYKFWSLKKNVPGFRHTTSLFQAGNEVIHIVRLHQLKNSRASLKKTKKLAKNIEM